MGCGSAAGCTDKCMCAPLPLRWTGTVSLPSRPWPRLPCVWVRLLLLRRAHCGFAPASASGTRRGARGTEPREAHRQDEDGKRPPQRGDATHTDTGAPRWQTQPHTAPRQRRTFRRKKNRDKGRMEQEHTGKTARKDSTDKEAKKRKTSRANHAAIITKESTPHKDGIIHSMSSTIVLMS